MVFILMSHRKFICRKYISTNRKIQKSKRKNFPTSLFLDSVYKRLKKTPIKIFTIYADEITNPNAEMNNLNYLRNKFIITWENS